MKTYHTFTTLILTTLFLFVASSMMAAISNYYTIADGDWSNPDTWLNGDIPPVNNQNDIVIYVYHDVVYTPGADPMEFKNNFEFHVEESGSLEILADFKMKNNVTGIIDGVVHITGDFTAQGGGTSTITGDGSLLVDGAISDPNNIITPSLLNNVRYAISSGNWSTDANWSLTSGGTPASAPTSNCIVYIESGYAMTLNTDVAITELLLYSGATLTIPELSTLTVSDTTEINGSMILKSSFSGTGAYINQDVVLGAGTVIVERLLTRKYSYVSMPFNHLTPAALNDYITYAYDEAGGGADWLSGWYSYTGNMTPGLGFAVYYTAVTTEQLTGTPAQLNTANNITVPVTLSGVAASETSYSWNLVGNPFPSGLDADAFISDADNSELTGTLYFWDQGAQPYESTDYATYTLLGGVSGAGGYTPGATIALGQGFFVQAQSAGNLSFKESMRTGMSTGLFFKKGEVEKEAIPKLKMNLTNANNQFNEIMIGFSPQATEAYDRLYDGYKIHGSSDIALYTLLNDTAELAIQALPVLTSGSKQSVALAYETATGGQHRLNISAFENLEEADVWLEDTYSQEITELSIGADYQFLSEAGRFTDRFIVHFEMPELQKTFTEIAQESTTIDAWAKVYLSKQTLVIDFSTELEQTEIGIWDMTGRQVMQEQLTVAGKQAHLPLSLRAGAYVVRLQAQDKSPVSKRIVLY